MSKKEEIKKKKLEKLMQQQQQGQDESMQQLRQQQQEEMKEQIKKILKKILTPEAKQRLGNIRAARPQFAQQIEMFLLQMYQSGRVSKQLSDEELKKILKKIKGSKKDISIKKR